MRAFSMKVSSLVTVASCALAVFSAARGLNIFLEAYAAEASEHADDENFDILCQSGEGSTSLRMRTACLQLRQARSTPMFLKAALRAFDHAYHEFSNSIMSWRNVSAMIMFVMLCVASPFLRLVRCFLPYVPTSIIRDEEDESPRVIVLKSSDMDPDLSQPGRMWHHVRSRIGRKPLTMPAFVEELEDSGSGWLPIDLSSNNLKPLLKRE